MKRMTLPSFIKLITNAGIELDDTKKKLLSAEYKNYKEPVKARSDVRILMIRSLVAKGISAGVISRKLGIQRYQVYTALNRRKKIADDRDWKPETIKQSDEYKNMGWSEDEFEDIVSMPNKGDVFDYSKLREFKDVLVV